MPAIASIGPYGQGKAVSLTAREGRKGNIKKLFYFFKGKNNTDKLEKSGD